MLGCGLRAALRYTLRRPERRCNPLLTTGDWQLGTEKQAFLH
jgi:hypothetical protein